MADPTPTSHYSIQKPVPNQVYTESDNWGTYVNSGLDIVDDQMYKEELYGSGVGTLAVATASTVGTHTTQITAVTGYASGVGAQTSTNTSSISSVINYASGTEAKVYPYFSPNNELPPFHAIRLEYSSGLGVQSGLTVTEGFNGTNLFVQAVSSQAYQEHLDMYFAKKFPPSAAFGANTIELNFDADSTVATDAKVVTTVFQNGTGQTPEMFTYSADQSYTDNLNSDLKHVWHMENTSAEDAVGAFDLTNTGTVESSSGIYNHCLDFENGDGDYLTHALPYPTNFIIPNTGDFTYAVFIKPESDIALSTTRDIAFKQVTADMDTECWALTITRDGFGRKFVFLFKDGMGPNSCTQIVGDDISGKWWMIAGRFYGAGNVFKLDVGDCSTGTLYSTSEATVETTQAIGTDFIIGARYAWDMELVKSIFTTNSFDGLMDEASYWNAYKSDTDIENLFNAGIGRFYGVSAPSTKLSNIGSNWQAGDALVLKTELYTSNNNAVRLYGIDFDLG
jgi:hypothetical protein